MKNAHRRLLRASFPLVAMLSALLGTALLCLLAMLSLSWYHASVQEKLFIERAEHVSSKISPYVTGYESDALQAALLNMAPDGAAVIGLNGEVFYRHPPTVDNRRTQTVPVLFENKKMGDLVLVVPASYDTPIPLAMMLLSTLFCSILAAIMVYRCARWMAQDVENLSRRIEGMTSQKGITDCDKSIAFAEFRRLNLAISKSLRRVMYDISHIRQAARMDDRTGLINDKAMEEHISLCLETATFENPGALICFEMSMLSDHLERQYVMLPDAAIREAAQRLRVFVHKSLAKRNLPPEAWVLAGLPGDLFALVLMTDGAKEELSSIIRDLQMDMHHPLKADGQSFTINIVGSIIRLPEDGDTVRQLRQRAQATLADLKAQGKSGFGFYSPRLERQRDARIKLESELREAVEFDRFVPLFQPKIDLVTGHICGAEALARWQLENGRLVAPSVFIELAEQTGLINSIGEQIMRKSCLEAAQWVHRGHRLNLAVNVSPSQFEQEYLSQMIMDSLARSGLSPRHLEIEITESLAIKQHDKVRSVLNPLKKMGIKLAVDDFGTGHSNLAVLTKIDFDVFKIDRQFVMGTPGDPQANAIVEMILSMANTLNMQIVGEGIETPEQARFLLERGCHVGQGYLYSPPITAAAFRKMLQEQPFVKRRMRAV